MVSKLLFCDIRGFALIMRMRWSIDAFPRMNAPLSNSMKNPDRMETRNYTILIFYVLFLLVRSYSCLEAFWSIDSENYDKNSRFVFKKEVIVKIKQWTVKYVLWIVVSFGNYSIPLRLLFQWNMIVLWPHKLSETLAKKVRLCLWPV